MTSLLWTLAAALASGVASGIVIVAVRSAAQRHQLLDIPVARSSHRLPRPRLGGVGVVAAVAVGAAVISALGLPGARVLITLTALSVIVAGVSLADDVWGLPVLPRLMVHIAVAVLTVWQIGGVRAITMLPGVDVQIGWIGDAATVVFIVALINVFNFMDGVDGMAGAQTVSASAAWVAIAWLTVTPAAGWAAGLLLGATLGFLWHNWEPSTIFLGDAGATFLGYWLAVLPLSGVAPQLFLPGLLVVWPFVADAAYTFLNRARRGESLISGHRDHIYQRLVASGWSHARVSLLYAALSLVGGVAAIGMATIWWSPAGARS